MPLCGLHVLGIESRFAQVLESEEDFGVELCPGDVGWKSEFHAGREVFVDVVGGVEVCCKGEESCGNDDDVDCDCGGVEVLGEWVGQIGSESAE